MSPEMDPTPAPDLGMPEPTGDAEVDAALSELVSTSASQAQRPVEAKVAAATRAHQRLQAILAADRE